MNYKNILKVSLAALTGLAVLSGCAQKEFEEITDLSLARCLEPQNLSARVDAATGDNVTFGWDVNKDAGGYELVVYTDEAMSQMENSWALEPGQVPFTTRLTADQKYWFTVQAYKVDANGDRVTSTLSHLAVYDGNVKTYAVKDNLYLEVTGRTENSVSFAWSKDLADYDEVTEIRATPVKGGQEVKYELSGADKSAATATVSGLAAGTEYQFVLYYMSASRGAVDTWTKAEKGAATTITSSEELKTAVNAGGDLYLAYSDDGYSMSTAKPVSSLTVVGELNDEGKRPVVSGSVEISGVLADGSSLRFENIHFADNGSIGHLVTFADDNNAVSLEKIEFVNCEITGYKSGLFSVNKKGGLTVGEVTFDSCDIYDILGSGGDGFDVRQACEITTVKFVNNTIYDGFRTLFRLDQVEAIKIGTIDFENNTVKNIATMDDGNNRALFSPYVPVNLILKKNLFLYEDGGKTDEGVVDKAQLIHDNTKTVDPTITASGNYAFAYGKDFFKRKSAADLGCKTMNVDPCYNSKGNFFHLAAQDLIEEQVGASKWWISYVEKAEDLTQNVVSAPHVWDLQDASLFAGEVKNSRVRDELLLVGSEATPINADGGINFTVATVLNRKGIPTDGYVSFKIDAPGSVDLVVEDPNKSGAGVVIALLDDDGFAVKGGVAEGGKQQVQKVVIPEVKGQGIVYLYANGPVSVTKLAWSKDVLNGDRVLATPKLTVDPVTVKEGDETPVTVKWDAVPNAASYELRFNRKPVELEEGALTYTVPAETIAALEAGLYGFTVKAFPAEGDIYYQESEQGTASIAIQPKGGSEVVTQSVVWDFTAEYIEAFTVNDSNNYLYDKGLVSLAASTDATETLYFSPNGKDIKYAGKKGADGVDYKPITFGGGAAYAFFKTSKSGKLVITATQGKVAADGKDCKLGIKVNGTSQSDDDVALEPYDLEKPLLDAKVYEWNIENTTGNVQEIQIVKVGGSTSPWIYRIEFIYSEEASEAPVYTWNFTTEYIEAFTVNDNNNYLYDKGLVSLAASTDATETLYFSPNGKDIKYAGKKGADGVDYKPITFGGGAAYAFFKTSKSGKLVITATQGKVAADGKDCKLGIKVNGTSQSDDDVALEPYDLEKPLLDAKVYEWNIENTTGNVQEIQIVKVGGSTSPWIYEIVFKAK